MGSETIKEFVVDLGWNVRADEQRRFVESIEKVQKGVMAIGAAFGALEIAQKFEKTARTLESIYFVAARSGTAAVSLKDLEFAYTKVGGSAEEAAGLVQSLAEKLRVNPLGIKGAFENLGVVATDANGKFRDTLDLIGDLDKALSNRPPQQRLAIERDIFGLDAMSMIKFRETEKFLTEHARKRTLLGFDEKSVEEAHAFENELRDIKDTLELMWESEASKLFERFGGDLKRFDEFLREHHQGIATALEIILAPLVVLGTVLLVRVVPGLNGMLAGLTALTRLALPGWLLGMLGVPGAAVGLGAAVMPQPLGPGEDERYRQAHPGWVPGQPRDDAPADSRNFWQRHAPKLLGGQDAPATGVGSGKRAGGGDPAMLAQIDRVSAGDPEIRRKLLSIYAGESKKVPGRYDVGDRGTSFGPLQFHRSGPGSIGTDFERDIHKNLNDPSTIPDQFDYAARWLKNHPRVDPGTVWFGYRDRGKRMVDQGWGGRIPSPAPAAPWKDFVPPNFTLPPGHTAADPFGFHADIDRRARQQGSWSNSVTNHNVNMGGQKTTINIDGPEWTRTRWPI